MVDGIKQYNPEFPNNEEARAFLKTCLEIAKIYDSIVDATEKDSEDKEYMPVDAANVPARQAVHVTDDSPPAEKLPTWQAPEPWDEVEPARQYLPASQAPLPVATL